MRIMVSRNLSPESKVQCPEQPHWTLDFGLWTRKSERAHGR